ncbi:hypothetical protein [Lacunimicrobium album]
MAGSTKSTRSERHAVAIPIDAVSFDWKRMVTLLVRGAHPAMNGWATRHKKRVERALNAQYRVSCVPKRHARVGDNPGYPEVENNRKPTAKTMISNCNPRSFASLLRFIIMA